MSGDDHDADGRGRALPSERTERGAPSAPAAPSIGSDAPGHEPPHALPRDAPGEPEARPRGALRRALDALYDAAGLLAACFLVAMLLLILVQMAARWTGLVFRGAPDYAGYCMASASFLAFAHALNRGAHIRVTLVLQRLGARAARVLEIWCLAVGAVTVTTLAWYAIRAVRWSYRFGDVSQGQDATPLWIPQLGMAVGAVLLALCFWDNLLSRLLGHGDNLRRDAPAGH